MIKKDKYWIRQHLKLLEYQIIVFEREKRNTIKKRDRLVETRDYRAKAYGLRFKSKEELNEAYIAGLVDDLEYRWQRNALWQVYDDRGAEMRLEWIESELKKYKDRQRGLYAYIEELKEEQKKKGKQRERRHHKRGYYRKTRERMAREREEEERNRKKNIEGHGRG